jgi:hypothetical protein
MAQDELEKSVQSIKDPTERKKAYYTAQRQQAERKAFIDSDSASKAAKINAKLGKTDKAKEYSEDAANVKKLGSVGGGLLNTVEGLSRKNKPVGEMMASGGPEGGAAKGAISAASKFVPEAESAVGGGLKALEGKVGQWLGKAKPVSSEAKALRGSKSALPSKASSQKALPGKTVGKASEQKALTGPKGTGRAKSSPTERDKVFGTRLNPQTGKPVGRGGMEIMSRATNRAAKKDAEKAVGEMNKQASKQKPRSRAMRNAEIGGKRMGSSRKGKYVPAKLKAREED